MKKKKCLKRVIFFLLLQTLTCSYLMASNNSTSIVINEFLASNSSINMDDDSDYSDWIELYNIGQNSIDLTSYTLTDDPTIPGKWPIPSVVLNPGEYLLIWASGKNRTIGDNLHTNFKLSAGGEFVGLYDPSANVVDSIYFGQQVVDVSMARIPNGNGDFEHTNNPTPLAINRPNDAQLNSLTLISPNGSESWFVGSIRFIEWTWTGFIQQVRLEYSTNNGINWNVIDESATNDGSKNWIVPASISNSCLIRVTALNDEIVSDISDDVFSIVDASPHNSNITINEFLTFNDTLNADDDGDYEDWIELYNAGSITIDLTGYYLTDDPGNPYQWKLPTELLFPNDYLLIWASGKNRINGDTLHTNFRLSSSGEFLGLYDPIGVALDTLSFGVQLANVSIARIPNGTGDFELTDVPTPEDSNLRSGSQLNAILVGSPNGGENYLAGTLQEIMWDWTGLIDFVRIEFSSDNGNSWQIVEDNVNNDGKTNWIVPSQISSNCQIRISDANVTTVSDVSDSPFTIVGQTPHYADLVINEFLALNDSSFADEDGDFEDWIEILNTGSSSVDLANYYLSDDSSNPYKWQFSSVVLDPQQYLLVWASGKNKSTDTTIHTNFQLSSSGEYVGLYDPMGAVLDSLTFPDQQPNIAMARIPDGTGDFQTTNIPTPENSNSTNVPVELSCFAAQQIQSSYVLLEWHVASELNNLGFEIERKFKNNEFENVGFVKGRGTSTHEIIYSFRDKIEDEGIYYYRLKQIDLDGSIKFYPEKKVTVTLPKTFAVKPNYPNPFNNSTMLSFYNPNKNQVEIKVFNIRGEIVSTILQKELDKGDYKINWDGTDDCGSTVPTGTYYIKFLFGDKSKALKTLLLK
jgi:hypothetical protein